ncbi:hypothetical protein TruAng_011188 [Truncatella angustata]|nr:hypothetical protein TruAng_011188 [Truncatella angustata]
MGLRFLGLTSVGWNGMTGSWWERLIAAFLLATLILGLSYSLYTLSKYLIKRAKNHSTTTVSRPVARYLHKLRQRSKQSAVSVIEKPTGEELKTFGVFLGSFAQPPTRAQQSLLSKWHVLVVDPLQDGVVQALQSYPTTSREILARIDIDKVAESTTTNSSAAIIQKLEILLQTMDSVLGQNVFTGLIITNFRLHFKPAIVNEVSRHARLLGRELWLELSYPDYISEAEAKEIDMNYIRGLIYQNGTMRPDGDRQNYFQMEQMRTVMRAAAAQRVTHGPALVMMETVDDDASIQYAVATRTYNWSTFNSALCWIGHQAALYDATLAHSHALASKPLGALMWLKDEANMKAHEYWRKNDKIATSPQGHRDIYESLSAFIPDIHSRLHLFKPNITERDSTGSYIVKRTPPSSFLEINSKNPSPVLLNDETSGLGCFMLGHDATFLEFDQIRRDQLKLRDLDLLAKIEGNELKQVCRQIETLRDADRFAPGTVSAINELLDLLDKSTADPENAPLKVFSGLHSGFQTSSGAQYWGLYDVDPVTQGVVLFLSNKAKERAATILHTFLSSKQVPRVECFDAERTMAIRLGTLSTEWLLPKRLVQDVQLLSPAEMIQFSIRISARPRKSEFFSLVAKCMKYHLISVPMLTQQRALNSVAYLNNDVTAEQLITSRLEWLSEKRCWVPQRSEAVRLFVDIDIRLYTALVGGESEVYARLGYAMQQLAEADKIDAGADILALSIISAFRKLAMDEVYLETLDRNPYPNHAADQAACFAENFALGSRCDSFFDMTPRNVGKIVANRYREYYMKYQPPRRTENFTELPTAYAAMQSDIDPTGGEEKTAFSYRFTFFGIFAIPALIDVMLLTTVGRGLYLTTFMSSEQKTMATTALMCALLLTGAFGQWICSGGSYYFYANGFPAMNLFILTRLTAGVALSLLVAVVGFVVIISTQTATAAGIFLFYFVMLSTYLLVLNALSIYQLPGSEFLSGRTVIITCIPILFISPIASMAYDDDIRIYLPVLSTFLLALLWRARDTVAMWSSWYLAIPYTKDSEIIEWYREHASEDERTRVEGWANNEIMPIARTVVHNAVLKDVNRWFFQKQTSDPFIKKLSDGYGSTMFLMRWYCRHKRSWMPLAYSTTWNLTLKAGMENMTNMQKGLKLHSAFLHWRSTGKDIWSGLLYFVVALLDKWAALFTGGGLVGLSAASSEEFRLGVGFGLCYYLVGAVALDTVSQPLWTAANEKINKPITSLESLKEANKADNLARRSLYWRSLSKFFFLHLWGAAVFAALMWAFSAYENDSIMFLCYFGAYSGLLWYQYNKIYCGLNGAAPLAVGAVVGFPVGIALHKCLPYWSFGGIVSLAIATWTAGFYSMFVANIGLPNIMVWKRKTAFALAASDEKTLMAKSYSVSTLKPSPDLSQTTMSQLFDCFRALPVEDRYTLDPQKHPGRRILELLSHGDRLRTPPVLKASFHSAQKILDLAAQNWLSGEIVIELVSSRHKFGGGIELRSISRKSGDTLHLIVILGPDRVIDEWVLNVQRHWKIIAEQIVQSFSEHKLAMSHDDATLAELLVVEHSMQGGLSVPEGIKRQLETCSSERVRLMKESDKTYLSYLLLGLDCEQEWESLSESVRTFLLQRCLGAPGALEAGVEQWLCTRIGSQNPQDVDIHIARNDLGAALTKSVKKYAQDLEDKGFNAPDENSYVTGKVVQELYPVDETHEKYLLSVPKKPVSTLFRGFNLCVKFLVLSLTADPEYQRELDFVLRNTWPVVRWPLIFFLTTIWSYCKLLQNFLIPSVLFYRHEHVTKLQKLMRGTTTTLEKNRLTTENFNGPASWFWTTLDSGSLRLFQYAGKHDSEPSDQKGLMSVNTYNNHLILSTREVYSKGKIINSFEYEYENPRSKLPMQRKCLTGERQGELAQYDHRGYITTGSAMRGKNRVNWKNSYRHNAKHEDELLWAEYIFPHITIKVLWSMPPRNPQKRLEHWIPFSAVTEATYIQGDKTWHASWDFEHKFHPEVSVTLNGKDVETPLMISEDWFHVLEKPENCSFLSENPLLEFSSIKSNPVSRLIGLNVRRYPIPTAVARTQLWKAWKDGREVDAISARWMDEELLRADKIMRPYWRRRDFCRLEAAKSYVDAQADTIMARVDINPQVSAWIHIAFKMSDLYTFGTGGESSINTRHLSSQLLDSEYEIHVLCMDTSTWPNDPGGVSACRRDMVNDLNTIKWHVLAESANDYGVPRFQIEQNVQSLTILPLWGLDFLNPIHGVLESNLDTQVVQRTHDTRTKDILQNFIPILSSLVKCARTINLTREHVDEATKALVNLNTYFETSRNWNDVWTDPVVKEKWRELWLSDCDKSMNIDNWWNFEMPTIKHLDDALNLWCRYLFIFSLPVPEQIPDIFQASHHFTGATYGIVCKEKRDVSLHIWDHCISYREFTTFMSSAVSYDSPFVNSSLISLTHLSCVLLEHHADVVLPCCDYFNPGWEEELGTAEGAIQHRRTFARKIDPVVNGITSMEKFEPTKTIKTDTPTVVMLSHVQYAKDIKNAIMATDLIVNKWGFRDYQLHIYGDQERAATIATECQELIAAKGLIEHVILKGLGNPSVVLQDAWLFLNSSISEGLPLAMGEAALTGVPVVCTDVGASYCVVTDRTTGNRFSEVVPPNDSESLARAQVNILALLGRWAEHAEQGPDEVCPVLEYPVPSPESVKKISERMYAKREQRRGLGMLGRQNVFNNFSSHRYLREHEQMLWLGKLRSGAHRARERKKQAAISGADTPLSARSSLWFSKEAKSPYANWSRPTSRLTPESWISLTSEDTRGGGWMSASGSTYSVTQFFAKEKPHGKTHLSVFEVQDL